MNYFIILILLTGCATSPIAKVKLDACEEKPSDPVITVKDYHWSAWDENKVMKYYIVDKDIHKCYTHFYNERNVKKEEYEK